MFGKTISLGAKAGILCLLSALLWLLGFLQGCVHAPAGTPKALAHQQPAILHSSAVSLWDPTHIALLLPLEGQHLGSARAIEAGFLKAFEQDPRVQRGFFLPKIQLYDTSKAASMAQLYAQALAQGATVIIGPLLKKDVHAMAKLPLQKPVLALNRSQEAPSSPALFFQMALDPETEALQLADFAYEHKHQRRLGIVATSDERSARFAKAFEERWTEWGGAITHRFVLAPHQDPAAFARSLLSQRASYDMVVLAAPEILVKQWNAYLRYHEAEAPLPRYVPSIPRWDLDVEGLIMADIPLRVEKDLRDQVADLPIEEDALYALGHDAYELIFRMPDLLAGDFYNGWSGQLSLKKQGSRMRSRSSFLQRRLMIIQVRDGRALVLKRS